MLWTNVYKATVYLILQKDFIDLFSLTLKVFSSNTCAIFQFPKVISDALISITTSIGQDNKCLADFLLFLNCLCPREHVVTEKTSKQKYI